MPTKQFLISGTMDAPSVSATEYSSLLGDGNKVWTTTEANRESIISTPGKLSNFKVAVRTAPGSGKSWTFTIRKAASGATMVDTDLSVTISGTATLSSLDTDEVTVAAGERVTIAATPSGTPTSADAVYWTCQFTPDTDGETILLSNTSGASITTYSSLIGGNTQGIEFNGQTLFPTAGTLKKFYVELTVAPGSTYSRTFTIRKNGVDQSLTVTISGTGITGNDIANTVSVAAGDKITIIHTYSGYPAASAAKFGITFLPDVQGEYIASATTSDPTDTTYVEYQHLNCGVSNLWGISFEWYQHNLAQATTVKKMYVNLSTAPGSGYSWVFTLRDDLADTALVVTISNTNTSGNAATDVEIAADSLLDTKIDATAGAATSATQIAYLLYNAPVVVAKPRSFGYIIG